MQDGVALHIHTKLVAGPSKPTASAERHRFRVASNHYSETT